MGSVVGHPHQLGEPAGKRGLLLPRRLDLNVPRLQRLVLTPKLTLEAPAPLVESLDAALNAPVPASCVGSRNLIVMANCSEVVPAANNSS